MNGLPDRVDDAGPTRRRFLTASAATAMTGGLVAGYGMFTFVAGRFLYPSGRNDLAWQFVATLDQLSPGESMAYIAPNGARVVIARQGEGETADDFVALSSVCPHLGCQVHWEPHHQRFFCPCHNGAFDPEGRATEGPPAMARQSLSRFPLQVQNRLLYILVPISPSV